MRGDERDGEAAAGQEHREILHAAAGGEKFRLARKLEADLVHSRLVNRAGHDRVDFAGEGERGGFFERRQGGAGAGRQSVGLTSDLRSAEDAIIRGFGQLAGSERRPHDLRADAGGVAECDADA